MGNRRLGKRCKYTIANFYWSWNSKPTCMVRQSIYNIRGEGILRKKSGDKDQYDDPGEYDEKRTCGLADLVLVVTNVDLQLGQAASGK